jgi:hypothetical protein
MRRGGAIGSVAFRAGGQNPRRLYRNRETLFRESQMSRYKVHSAVIEDRSVEAKTDDGREVTAMVPGLVVELVPDGDHGHGAVTRRYVPPNDAEMQELLVKYAVGRAVLVTTEPGGDAPEPDLELRRREPGAQHPIPEPEAPASTEA